MTTQYVVGKRDAKHRKFLGWGVVRAGMQINYYIPYATRELAENTAKQCPPGTRVVRVFAVESERRQALRELVDAIERDLAPSDQESALEAAKSALEAW